MPFRSPQIVMLYGYTLICHTSFKQPAVNSQHIYTTGQLILYNSNSKIVQKVVLNNVTSNHRRTCIFSYKPFSVLFDTWSLINNTQLQSTDTSTLIQFCMDTSCIVMGFLVAALHFKLEYGRHRYIPVMLSHSNLSSHFPLMSQGKLLSSTFYVHEV